MEDPSEPHELEGTLLLSREFDVVEGRLVIENGRIAAIEETTTDSTDIILPSFVNAHTHIGDSIAKEAGAGLSLDELVAPPDGLKHQLLRDASDEELVAAMRRSLEFMYRAGTGAFIEFREGGVSGVAALVRALAGQSPALRGTKSLALNIEPVILGRETIDAMEMDASAGFGASGARDNEFAQKLEATRAAGKIFAIHAGERDPHDIDPALDLEPEFLVHMVYTQPRHFDRLAESKTPVVVCPRSNLVTGVGMPPIRELAEHTTVALGTDNVMLNSPSMFREMEFVCKLTNVSARETLRMATVAGAEIAGLNCGIIETGRKARLLVLDGDSDNLTGVRDPVRAVVRRAGVSDVKDAVTLHSHRVERSGTSGASSD